MNTAKWNEAEQRWFVDGEPVHAGTSLEMQGRTYRYRGDLEIIEPSVKWFQIRIESRDCGRQLDAYTAVHGYIFCNRDIAGFSHGKPYCVAQLRWAIK